MLVAVLILRFLVELALFAGAAVAAALLVSADLGRILLGLLGCVAAITVWSLFLSPKRPTSWPLSLRIGLEVSLFVIVGAGLWNAGFPGAGIALLMADLLVLAALFLLGDQPGRHFDLTDRDALRS